MIQSVSWTGWMTISSCKIPETAGAYIRTADWVSKSTPQRPGLGRCDLAALLLAASPQCTQVLKWHAADHFDCGGPASTLAWACVAYRLSPPSPCATSRHAALVGSCLAAASVFCRATASARQRLGSVGVLIQHCIQYCIHLIHTIQSIHVYIHMI